MVSLDLLGSMERRVTGDYLDLRVLQEARVMLVLVVLKAPSAPLVLLVFLVLKDRRVPRDQLVHKVRRETLD